MLPHQRHLEIQNTLERQGGVKVSELARRLHVTEETIRRDLVALEEAKCLIRTHGGAIPLESNQAASPYHLREVEQVEAKRSIARRAVQELEEEDIVFLDGSTTAYQLARVFPDLRCTVITHSEPIFTELSKRTNVELISTGGLYDRRSASFVGPLAEQLILACQITKAFLGCKGLDLQRGFSDASVRHMNLKRSVIRGADRVFLLADHTKFGIRSRYYFAEARDIYGIITDRKAPDRYQSDLRTLGIHCWTESHRNGVTS